ncbi:MAG: hypothetical protein AAGB06_06900 [Verrucomicrobiota bacterium]
MNPPPLPSKKSQVGFIDPKKVRILTFGTVNTCLGVSVVACLLAIWDFAEQDILWRTVATCVVLACGMILFSGINQIFGNNTED